MGLESAVLLFLFVSPWNARTKVDRFKAFIKMTASFRKSHGAPGSEKPGFCQELEDFVEEELENLPEGSRALDRMAVFQEAFGAVTV